jgi:hypothetical protein
MDAVGADAIHRIKFGDGVFTVWSSVGRFPSIFSSIASCRGNGDLLSISDLGYQKEIEKKPPGFPIVLHGASGVPVLQIRPSKLLL